MQVPHNRTFVALGTGLLWFGWFGFNGGSAGAANGQARSTALQCFSIIKLCKRARLQRIGRPRIDRRCIRRRRGARGRTNILQNPTETRLVSA